MTKYYVRRGICLLVGLFVLALGIALSTKCGLGVSPTSSVPYVFSLIFPAISMGTMTMIMNLVFTLLQILILRKDYKPIYLLQLVVVFFFSFFTDFTLDLVKNVEVTQYPMQLLLFVGSNVIIAIGVFLEVRAGLLTMATEGLISAIAKIFKFDFGTTKIVFDWTMVVISGIASLIAFHKLSGVREGTVIAAFLVGYIVRILNKYFSGIYTLLGFEKPGANAVAADFVEEAVTAADNLVITIEREWGSGGHEIGERIAKELNIPFYDYAVISQTAEKTGLTPDEIRKKEQKIGYGLLHTLSSQAYLESQEKSTQDSIFEAQRQVIKDFANQGSCVIVGRLGSYVLKNRKNCFHIFVTAADEFRNDRIAEMMKIEPSVANGLRKKEDQARARHCEHFTGEPWGMARHYALTLDTSKYGVDRAVELVKDALEKRKNEI